MTEKKNKYIYAENCESSLAFMIKSALRAIVRLTSIDVMII